MKNRQIYDDCLYACAVLLWVPRMVRAAEEKSALPLPDSGNVTLTLDEYNRLVELAAKPPKKSDLAPLPYSIKHADVKLRVENDGVRGTVELEGEVFRKGVSKVPLTSGMTILDAHQNGKGVPCSQENGTHMALLPGPGEFSVALDTGLPLRIEAGRASFTLPAPAAGSVQLALVIPGDHTFRQHQPRHHHQPQIGKRTHRDRSHAGSGTAREHLVGHARSRHSRRAARSAVSGRRQDADLGQRSGNARRRAGRHHGGAGRAFYDFTSKFPTGFEVTGVTGARSIPLDPAPSHELIAPGLLDRAS